ncbi:MAG: hypothetical protein AB1894_24570 [Chloroflexota bacterium]
MVRGLPMMIAPRPVVRRAARRRVWRGPVRRWRRPCCLTLALPLVLLLVLLVVVL